MQKCSICDCNFLEGHSVFYPKIYIQGFNVVVNCARRPNNFNNLFFLRVEQLYDLKKVELINFYKVELTMLQIDYLDYNNTKVFSLKNIVVQLMCSACKTNWAICSQGFEFSHFFYPLRILVKKLRIKGAFFSEGLPICVGSGFMQMTLQLHLCA